MPETLSPCLASSLTARLIHVVGRQNHGKTGFILDLVSVLGARGLTLGTVKHTGHEHELDTPGKDSHRHRLAGATPVAVVTASLSAVYLSGLDPDHPYTELSPFFHRCDLVLVEGHLDGPGPKLEVWRQGLGSPPLASTRGDILAVVSDDLPSGLAVPSWPRGDMNALVERLLAHPVFGPLLSSLAPA